MTQPRNHEAGPRPLQRDWEAQAPRPSAISSAQDPPLASETPVGAEQLDAHEVGVPAVAWGPPSDPAHWPTALPWSAAASTAPSPAFPAIAPLAAPTHGSPPRNELAEPPVPTARPRPAAFPPQDEAHSSTGTAADLSYNLIVKSRGDRPQTGWRAAAYNLTGGLWNPGLSPAEAERRQQIARTRAPLAKWHTITVASMKGGVGKTTVAALLGLMLAEHRGDRVIALDANPDAGTLADRLLGYPVLVTVRDLINNLHTIQTLTDVSAYTDLAGRLQVLASEQDPAMSESFNKSEYEAVTEVLKRFYNIIITDSGTGLIHSAMHGALDSTRTLVIVGAPTVDAGSRASKTLDWLKAHGYDDLVSNAVVALSCDRFSREIDRGAVRDHFAARCRAVVEIPQDPHLATGGHIQLEELRPATVAAALSLSAHIADQFGWRQHPMQSPAAPSVPDRRG